MNKPCTTCRTPFPDCTDSCPVYKDWKRSERDKARHEQPKRDLQADIKEYGFSPLAFTVNSTLITEWLTRAIEAERKLADHGPEGHNVTNAQHQALREKNQQLREALEGLVDLLDNDDPIEVGCYCTDTNTDYGRLSCPWCKAKQALGVE